MPLGMPFARSVFVVGSDPGLKLCLIPAEVNAHISNSETDVTRSFRQPE